MEVGKTPDNLFLQYLKTKKLGSVICSSPSETRPLCYDPYSFKFLKPRPCPPRQNTLCPFQEFLSRTENDVLESSQGGGGWGEVENGWEEGNRIKIPINGSSVTSKLR